MIATALLAMLGPSFPDPFSDPFGINATAGTWAGAMQSLSEKLLYSLAIIELCIVGFQAVIFKDSIVEFIRTFASKILMFIAIGFAITHFNLAMPTIIGYFSQVAQAVSSCPQGSTAAQCTAASQGQLAQACNAGKIYQCPPALDQTVNNQNATLIMHFVLWGMIYMMAADASKLADNIPGMAIGWTWGIPFPPDPGNGDPGVSQAFLKGHKEFQVFCMALGVICFMSAICVFVTLMLMTLELHVILAMGVITLALHGTKWSSQFAGAMPKYMINIGAKFFAYYFVVATCSIVLNNPAYEVGQLAGLIGGAVVPFGVASVVLAAATSPQAILTVVMAGLIYSIPQFASALVSGSSATSAAAVWGQMGSAMKQGSAMRQQGLGQDIDKKQGGGGAGGVGGAGQSAQQSKPQAPTSRPA